MLSILIPVLNLGLVKWSGLASGGIAVNSGKTCGWAKGIETKENKEWYIIIKDLGGGHSDACFKCGFYPMVWFGIWW